MGGLVKELNVTIHFISHLATPDGTPHEEGGRVMIRHFKGSRAIGFWSHFMYGLERNQQSDDPAVRGTTTLRCLKDRDTGNSTGECIYFGYDRDTGLLTPCDAPPKPDEAKKHGFKNETQDF
jgi:twinkle protein